MSAPRPRPGSPEITARSGRFSLPVRLSGQGIPMIFLHGLGSDSRDSARDLGELPGFRVALADQRGHGGSRPRPRPGEFELDSMVGDLRAMLTALGWPGAVVAGGSMGAAVALRHVLTGPGECPALVLVAPALGPDRPAAAAQLAAVADRIDAVGVQQAVAEIRGGPAGAGDGLDGWLRQDGAALAAGMRAVPSWRPFTAMDDLAAITLPVALVGIRGDPLHPVELAARMHARLPSSSLEILGSPEEAGRPGAIGAAVLRALGRLGVG
jgi:pimeloyl-ACP methyl ester carboxylesterase